MRPHNTAPHHRSLAFECTLVDAFLADQGHTRRSLRAIPAPEAIALLAVAALSACRRCDDLEDEEAEHVEPHPVRR